MPQEKGELIQTPSGMIEILPSGEVRVLSSTPNRAPFSPPAPDETNREFPGSGQDFVKGMGKSGLSIASLLGSFLPAGVPVRMALQGLLGGAHGALDEDESAAEQATLGASLEGLTGAPAGKLIRKFGNSAALWSGLGGTKHALAKDITKGAEAFTNQAGRQHSRLRTAIPVGASRRTQNRLRATGETLQETEEGVPTITNFADEAPGFRAAPRTDPKKMLGSTDPIGSANAIRKGDDSFVEGNEALLRRIRRDSPLHTPVTRVVDKGLPVASDKPETWFVKGHLDDAAGNRLNDMYKSGRGNVLRGELDGPINFTGEDELGNLIGNTPTRGLRFREGTTQSSDMTFRELSEIGRAQTREGSKLFTQLADGQWVRTADSPGTQAAATRGMAIKDRAKEVATDFDPNVAEKLESLNSELKDLYLMENLNESIRRGIGFGAMRAGAGATLGGAGAALTGGDYGTAAGAGAAAGFALSPKVISQLFNALVTGSKAGVIGQRGLEAAGDTKDLFSPNKTKRRTPK